MVLQTQVNQFVKNMVQLHIYKQHIDSQKHCFEEDRHFSRKKVILKHFFKTNAQMKIRKFQCRKI